MKTAVNMLAIKPTLNVTANPLIGPVPYDSKATAAISVVRLESKICWMVLLKRSWSTEPV